MIRIDKPVTPPEILTIKGQQKRENHIAAYSRNPNAYQSGSKTFNFDRTIYAHSTVKDALAQAQHRKCCYCESRINQSGDIEHFRPKQAYRQSKGESLQYPGYYWLAYEWTNLYFACTTCNRDYKKNLFPLQNPTKRASSHRSKLQDEQPLLIDPGQDNPEDFIGFRAEVAYAIESQAKGETTIQTLGLNRPNLQEERLEKLHYLREFHNIIQSATIYPDNAELQRLAKQCQKRLTQGIKNDAKFASAIRSAVQTNFQYVL